MTRFDRALAFSSCFNRTIKPDTLGANVAFTNVAFEFNLRPYVEIFVIMLLLLRFLVLLGFHPQIRVISNTLVRSFPFMMEFAFL